MSVKTWFWIPGTHVKLCVVVNTTVIPVFSQWDGRWLQETFQTLVPVSLVYVVVNNKSFVKKGERWEITPKLSSGLHKYVIHVCACIHIQEYVCACTRAHVHACTCIHRGTYTLTWDTLCVTLIESSNCAQYLIAKQNLKFPQALSILLNSFFLVNISRAKAG